MGPCLCGDYMCPSCGPAQGNSKCELCGTWASEIELSTWQRFWFFVTDREDCGCKRSDLRKLHIAEEAMYAEWQKSEEELERKLKENPNYLNEE